MCIAFSTYLVTFVELLPACRLMFPYLPDAHNAIRVYSEAERHPDHQDAAVYGLNDERLLFTNEYHLINSPV